MSGRGHRIALTGTPGTGKTTAARHLTRHPDSDPDLDRSGSPDAASVADAEGSGEAAPRDHEPIAWPTDEALAAGAVPVVHLNEAIERAGLHGETDPDRDSLYADLDRVERWLAEHAPDGDHVVESHLAHLLPADAVVVLRCDPTVLEARLRERGESPASARENAESEALDVVLAAAVERHGRDAVYEVDATELQPAEVADVLRAVRAGDREPAAGTVDFTTYLE